LNLIVSRPQMSQLVAETPQGQEAKAIGVFGFGGSGQ